MHNKVTFIVQSAVIGALYASLTLLFPAFSFGHNVFQLRISEALTVLPAFLPASIPGLFIGCVVANLIGGFGPIDILFGSLATLLAALVSRYFRHYPWLVPFPPVIFNALIVGSYLQFFYYRDIPLLASIGWVGLGELLACYLMGLPLFFVLRDRIKFPQD